MEMVVIEPSIENVHSPNEHLNIDSVNPIWKFLIALFKNLS